MLMVNTDALLAASERMDVQYRRLIEVTDQVGAIQRRLGHLTNQMDESLLELNRERRQLNETVETLYQFSQALKQCALHYERAERVAAQTAPARRGPAPRERHFSRVLLPGLVVGECYPLTARARWWFHRRDFRLFALPLGVYRLLPGLPKQPRRIAPAELDAIYHALIEPLVAAEHGEGEEHL